VAILNALQYIATVFITERRQTPVIENQLSLSRCMIHEASEARRPPRWRWTMHWPAVLPARVPAYNQCACGRVAAPRFIL
jgi:hypothetical protein